MSSVSGPGSDPDPFEIADQMPSSGSYSESISSNMGSGWDAFKSFLGPNGFKKFQQILMNMIRNQINQEQQKAKKATENLKLAEEGKPLNPD